MALNTQVRFGKQRRHIGPGASHPGSMQNSFAYQQLQTARPKTFRGVELNLGSPTTVQRATTQLVNRLDWIRRPHDNKNLRTAVL